MPKLTPPEMARAIEAGETVIVDVPDFRDPTGMAREFRMVISARANDVEMDYNAPGERTVGRWLLLFFDGKYPAALVTRDNYGYARHWFEGSEAPVLPPLTADQIAEQTRLTREALADPDWFGGST